MNIHVWVLLILLVGFALRSYGLGATGFWVDEARTGLAARLDFLQLLSFSRETTFEHPPVYFAILHQWLGVVKESDWTARFFAVIWGTLSLSSAFLLYRRLSNNTLAVYSTLLLALSPFHIAYSRDNRMYAWMGFLGLWLTIILLDYLSKGGAKRLIAYCILAFAGVFSHYMFAFLLSAHIIFLFLLAVLSGERRYWRAIGYVILIVAVLGLLLVVWTMQSTGPRDTVTDLISGKALEGRDVLQFMLDKTRKIANDFLLAEKDWSSVPVIVQIMIIGIWTLAIWSGLSEAARPKMVGREGSILFLVLLLVPVIGLLIVPQGVVGRYIIFTFPAFVFLVVLGIMKAWKLLPAIGVVVTTIVVSTIGFGHYTTLMEPKSDFSSAAVFLKQQARPSDRVLLTHFHDQPLAEYYIDSIDPMNIIHYPSGMTPATPNQVESDLPDLIQHNGRLWLGPVSPGTLDTEGMIEHWLAQHAFHVEKWWFSAGTYVSLFLLPEAMADQVRDTATPLTETLDLPRMVGNHLLLLNTQLNTTSAPAGSGVTIELDWEILSETNDDILVSLELRDADGTIWSQRLSPMQGGTLSSSQWVSGETVVDRHGLWIPEGMPPGAYRLDLRLYNATQGYALPIGEDARMALATITVEPGSIPIPAVPLERDLAPGLRLLGADRWPDFVEQGTRLPVTLYWLPQSSGLPEQTLRLELVDRAGKVASSVQEPLGPSWYPAPLWQANVSIKGTNAIDIPGRLQPGTYRLRAALLPTTIGSAATNSPPVELGKIKVTAKPRDFKAPQFRHPTDQTVGDFARLVGYNIQPESALSPGQAIKLGLVWKAVGETNQDYTVFVHLTNPDGQLVGQKDNPPRRGNHPTSSWLRGEYITDDYVVPVPDTLAPGAYSVYVGMYDPRSGQRLPVWDANNERWPADAVLIHQIHGE